MAERRQSFKLRRASDLGFSVFVVKREFTLHSGEAQSLLRHYNFTSDALYKLGNTLRQWAPEEKVLELQRHVFDNLINPLQEELTRLHEKYKSYSLTKEEEGAVTATKPFTDTAEISYAEAGKLLDLLIRFDQLLYRLAQLRFALKISESEYLRVSSTCRIRLKDDEKTIERLVREAINMAEKQAKTREELEEVEAAVARAQLNETASLAHVVTADPPGRGNGRRGRKAAEATSQAPEELQQSQGEKEGHEVAATGPEGEGISAFAL